ncbi:MAG: helix-turn-helix domain-containing protein [Caldilinea sp.]|nr:helix-turn-helix domain-containing protein [Caldilineaceae bacterium]MCB9123505.1 helix-turn-helix domain-containing protein [Caldilineaceae bacterium]MCO5212952.1 helix-turn-helix domain-containing protein [Caldilinea sp.]
MAETISFGTWIRQRRRALDLTQDALAERVGCSLSAIRKIESDERRPSRQVAELLAEALDVPPADRTTFLKVARRELGYQRLAAPDARTVETAVETAVAPAQNGHAAAAGRSNGGAAAPVRVLPRPPTPLVGRDAEVERIATMLAGPECRVLTLTGPGGIGKTRLAIAAAERLAGDFADGVCFVPLAAVTAPESICAAIAGVLGVRIQSSGDPAEQLAGFLHTRQILLVLDNLEHLLAGVGIVAALVQASAGVRVLATSRERLGLTGEWVLDVPGLGVPARAPAAPAELPRGWDHAGAVLLFAQAARRNNPGFELSNAAYAEVVRICQAVEGIPLGIELAAAWVRMLSCQEIAAEIERNLDFLSTPARDVPPRQRSLRAAFEHSWRLLDDEERAILPALAVFAGGFTRQAAEVVAGASLLTLASLMAKSLVERVDEGRYDLHEIVRQYAAEKLAAGDLAAAHERHWRYFLHLAQQADDARNRPQHMELVDLLVLESDNLQAALDWLIEHDAPAAWHMAGVMEAYWYRRPVTEARRWVERIKAAGEGLDPPIAPGVRARLLLLLATFQPNLTDTMKMLHEVLALARAGDERRILAVTLAMLGNEGLFTGEFGQSDAYFNEALALAQAAGDQATLSTVLAERGESERYHGHYDHATDLYTESLALAQAVGRTDLVAGILSALAKLALRQGDPQRAIDVIEPTLPIWEALHDRGGMAAAQLSIARAVTMQGDTGRALALIDDAEARFHDAGYHGFDQFIELLRGNVAYDQGDCPAARQRYADAIELCKDSFEPIVITLALRGVALCALHQDDLASAEDAIERSRQVCDATHETWVRALLEFAAGQLAWQRGEHAGAEAAMRNGLAQVLPLGDRYAVAEGLEQLAALLLATARPAPASRMLGAAHALRAQIGAPLPPVARGRVEETMAAVRAALGPDAFEVGWATGAAEAAAGLPQAVALALENE